MKLKAYLKLHGITQLQFSKDIDISRIHAQNIICGRSIAGRRIAKAIEAYTNGAVSRLEMLYPNEGGE